MASLSEQQLDGEYSLPDIQSLKGSEKLDGKGAEACEWVDGACLRLAVLTPEPARTATSGSQVNQRGQRARVSTNTDRPVASVMPRRVQSVAPRASVVSDGQRGEHPHLQTCAGHGSSWSSICVETHSINRSPSCGQPGWSHAVQVWGL